jgi:hypothetical protein
MAPLDIRQTFSQYFPIHCSLKMEADFSSIVFVTLYENARLHIPETAMP